MAEAARAVPGVLGVEDLRAEFVGPGVVHAGLRVRVARGTPIEQASAIADDVERAVHAGLPSGYCYVRADQTLE